jgi:hypothetical protein
MPQLQPLERTATEQLSILTKREKTDVPILEGVDRKDVARIRRRSRAHLRKMLVEQVPDVVPVQFALKKLPAHRHLV